MSETTSEVEEVNHCTATGDGEVIDLVIIGGGSAGLVAAKGAGNVGASVVMIEPNPPGGDCLWTGCVPSKSILSAAHAAHVMRTASKHGIKNVEPEIDFTAVMDSVRGSQEHISHHDSVETLESFGARAVSYTHLTLPTNREV